MCDKIKNKTENKQKIAAQYFLLSCKIRGNKLHLYQLIQDLKTEI